MIVWLCCFECVRASSFKWWHSMRIRSQSLRRALLVSLSLRRLSSTSSIFDNIASSTCWQGLLCSTRIMCDNDYVGQGLCATMIMLDKDYVRQGLCWTRISLDKDYFGQVISVRSRKESEEHEEHECIRHGHPATSTYQCAVLGRQLPPQLGGLLLKYQMYQK